MEVPVAAFGCGAWHYRNRVRAECLSCISCTPFRVDHRGSRRSWL
ncbi:MAG: hypothetical protein QOK27_2148 [Gemmatimonadales bacterium]|jgi:hypothetical protein|nr:hypothetical protein [Gemmatimonadales bacterium]